MDKLIYTAMTGASHSMQRLATVTQNLSNGNTPGYRTVIDAFRAVPLVGQGLPTRTFVVDSNSGYDFTQGAMQQTGRTLDIAVNGKGWIAVQMPDGSEAYTRNGNLQISPEGILMTRDGLPVAGDSGHIAIPPTSGQVSIAPDGTISAIPSGSAPSQITEVGRIKLVNPPEGQLMHGDDGLFHTANGKPADSDPAVTVVSGTLEDSNVNVVESMVDMISLSRQFDMQMKMLKTASDDAAQASQIFNVSG
jgi:flagellar basal-body rod protein FlgF